IAHTPMKRKAVRPRAAGAANARQAVHPSAESEAFACQAVSQSAAGETKACQAVRPRAAVEADACNSDDTADVQNPAATTKGKRRKRPRKNFYAKKPAKEGTRFFREDYVCLYLPCSGEYVLEPAWVITEADGSFEKDSVSYLQYGDGHFYSVVMLGRSRSEKYLNDQVYVHYAKRLLLEAGLDNAPEEEEVSRKRKKKTDETEDDEEEEEEKVDEIVEECVIVGHFDYILPENESPVLVDVLNSSDDSGIDVSEEHCYALICT
ncbi:hypothetical protein PFISCL1PPCAC_864, partial [Pristionchus fissidentatus]